MIEDGINLLCSQSKRKRETKLKHHTHIAQIAFVLSICRCNSWEMLLCEAKGKRSSFSKTNKSILRPLCFCSYKQNTQVLWSNRWPREGYKIKHYTWIWTAQNLWTSWYLHYNKPVASVLCSRFSSSCIISPTDLFAPKVAIIHGRSNFNWGSEEGSQLNFPIAASTSLCGSSELKSKY